MAIVKHTIAYNPPMESISKASIKTKMEIIHLVVVVRGVLTIKSILKLVISFSSSTKNLFLQLKNHKIKTIMKKISSLILQMNFHYIKIPFHIPMMFLRKKRKKRAVL